MSKAYRNNLEEQGGRSILPAFKGNAPEIASSLKKILGEPSSYFPVSHLKYVSLNQNSELINLLSRKHDIRVESWEMASVLSGETRYWFIDLAPALIEKFKNPALREVD